MGSVRETFILMPDFDGAIIGALAPEGSKVGFHVLAKQVKQVAKDLSTAEAKVSGASVAGRMKVLEHHGFVTSHIVQPVSAGFGWQRTTRGEAWLAQLTTKEQT